MVGDAKNPLKHKNWRFTKDNAQIRLILNTCPAITATGNGAARAGLCGRNGRKEKRVSEKSFNYYFIHG
jgi:hypothetical protein